MQPAIGIEGRAIGCMLGQLCGDALGSLVEFHRPDQIADLYPEGVRDMADGGVWDTIAGQPTDDSEMALALARSLVKCGAYDVDDVRHAYVQWLESSPFDCGMTVAAGLMGTQNTESQANGALMRISPLAIFGVGGDRIQLAALARQDAMLTHPHQVCVEVNTLYVLGLAHAIECGCDGAELFEYIRGLAIELEVGDAVMAAITDAASSPPPDFMYQMGWVLLAFQNALWQIVHAPSLEEGVVNSIMQGGDTDTNAAIAGAMLGAVHGMEAIPERWRGAVLSCRPEAGDDRALQPRPSCYWPCDAVELAVNLLR